MKQNPEIEEKSNVPVLIHAYGEYWDPELVDWSDSWNLLGKKNKGPKSPDINVYEQKGIYVLYKDFVPVYVGKALLSSIGYRLLAHRESSRKGPRWDSFSWFGLRTWDDTGELNNLKDDFSVKSSELIATLEALLIVVIDPKLNARREKLKGAVRLFQSHTDKPVEINDRLKKIDEDIQTILKRLTK